MPAPTNDKRVDPLAGQRSTDVPYQRLARQMAVEGGVQSAMAQLTGDIVLTGFAVALGAGSVLIGLLAALPLLLRLSQLLTWSTLERVGRWRTVALLGAIASRVTLLGAALIPFLSAPGSRSALLLAVVALSSVGASLYDLAIVSWMADLLPLRLRGDFFGRRNRSVAAVGLGVTLMAAFGLDLLPRGSEVAILGFTIVFLAGAAIGLAGILLVWQAPADAPHAVAAPAPLRAWLREATADRSFYRLVRFGFLWGFAVNFASPFFTVYQIQVLALPFTVITLYKAVTTAAMMGSARRWGKLADHFGSKPIVWAGTCMMGAMPLLWLATTPERVWPLAVIQILSGLGFAAYDTNVNNLVLKLAPPDGRPGYLATFGAAFGTGSAIAPVLGGAFLAFVGGRGLSAMTSFYVLFALGALLRLGAAGQLRGVREPGGASVGRMIRVMGRFRAMTIEFPFEPFLHYVYLPAARVADFVAPEPRAPAPRCRSAVVNSRRDSPHLERLRLDPPDDAPTPAAAPPSDRRRSRGRPARSRPAWPPP